MIPRLLLALPLVLVAATADARELCAPVASVYFAAKGNVEISDVHLITQKKIPAVDKIIPAAVDPAMPPSSGLLVVWHDRKAILFVVINELICGSGTDVLYDEIPKLQAALSERAAFKLHPKEYRKKRTRKPTRRSARKPVETPVIVGRAME